MFDSKVWVLMIENEAGFSPYAHITKEGAIQTLYNYVLEWWEDLDLMDSDPELASFTQEDAIEYYFEHIYQEWYTLDEVDLGA